jgi:hypothetical protein
MIKEHKEENEALRKEHKEEINALRSALEANTIAITELRGLLEHGQRMGNDNQIRQSTGDAV